jgi:hypothetical protein
MPSPYSRRPQGAGQATSLGEVVVPADKLWGAQTQCPLKHFSIGQDLIPREMISAYAILKKAAANANHAGKRLDRRTAHHPGKRFALHRSRFHNGNVELSRGKIWA